ncbi:MAG: NADP-dependent isocitrate dehydrogenase [Candidatus Sulfopaludibacter sp.]|nr:NADP-dependent isocitrate dehydrogenase [Candidatus Sulfopaludibacter sp.]
MSSKIPITVAHGDGIGPEIMNATLQILEAAGAALDIETIEIGEKVYLRGNSAGIEPSAWDSLLRTKVFLKAPITTPQGGGFKSLNVTTRKTLGQYANVRPCVSYDPFIDTKHPNMDVVIVRENEEDLYAGIEYQLTPEVTSCIKLISRPGSEKIVRYAFEYARLHNRKKVTCFMKDNIMKMTDGLFHKVFDEIAKQYPDIQNEAWIVDIGAAKMADTPEAFDVIVMPNLYGDILSDVAAQIAGSVGLAGSANIGEKCAMFEAIHGSAPRRAGQNLANPSGLLLGSVLMLVHINLPETAERVHNAWLRTIEDGVHTYDIFTEGVSTQKVGTKEFAAAVVARLGQKPNILKPVKYAKRPEGAAAAPAAHQMTADHTKMELIGIDVFVYWPSRNPNALAEAVGKFAGNGLSLQMIDNRGVKVWPAGRAETFCTDSFRCRFVAEGATDMAACLGVLQQVAAAGIEIASTQALRTFDGAPGFTLAQGQ